MLATKKTDVRANLISIEKDLNEYYYERKEAIRSVIVGMLSNLNVVMVGPPGTGKTDISQSFTSHITGARYFGTTLHQYSHPDAVFGTVDLKLIKETGEMKRMVEGYVPTANIVAIEEIFKAGKGMLNSLIEVAHPSRFFSNGPERFKTPILTIIGTSNELPVGEKDLTAIYDRMIIKIYVKPIEDSEKFSNMVLATKPYTCEGKETVSLEEIYQARDEVAKVKLDEGILRRMVVLREELSKEGVHPSDRTFKLCVGALQANAYMEGRDEIIDEDLMYLKHMLWYETSDEPIVLRTLINMIKPELRRLAEIYDAVHSAATEALESDNDKEMVAIHKKIRASLDEAKTIRNDMVRKKRNTEECDEIVRKLKGYAGKLSKKLIGVDTEDDKEHDHF